MPHDSSIQPQKPQLTCFEEKLASFARSEGIWNGYLIVDNGILKETHLLELLWEKFKNLIGMDSKAKNDVIRETVNDYLIDHIEDIQNDPDIENVKALAKKAGITPSNGYDQLINKICKRYFEKIALNTSSASNLPQITDIFIKSDKMNTTSDELHNNEEETAVQQEGDHSLKDNIPQEREIKLEVEPKKEEKIPPKKPELPLKELSRCYETHEIEILSDNLNNKDGRMKFEEWLINHFSPDNATADQFNWHSQVISLLCAKAREDLISEINQDEDLLLASLISKAEPLHKKEPGFLRSALDQAKRFVNGTQEGSLDIPTIFCSLKDANLPSTCTVILRRSFKYNNLFDILWVATQQNNSAMIRAAITQHPEDFKAAMKMKSEDSNTLLLFAAYCGSLEILKLMANAAPDEFKAALTIENVAKWTPLHHAVRAKSAEILKFMSVAAPDEFKAAMKMRSKDVPSVLYMLKAVRIKDYKEISQIFKSNSELRERNKTEVNRKALAHAYHISGTSSLIERKTKKYLEDMVFEGHKPQQWFHLMSKNLRQFHENYPHSLNKNELSVIMQVMDLGANEASFSLEDKLHRIKEGFPTVLNTGFEAHAVTLLIWENQFIICDRGGTSKCPIKVYHFDPQLIDSEDLKKIEAVKDGSKENYQELYFEILPKKLMFSKSSIDEVLEKAAPLPFQTVGNCSFVSPITAIYAVMLMTKMRGIDEKGRLNKGDLSGLDDTMLATHVNEVVSLYQTWLAHEQIAILERNVLPLKEEGLAFETDHSLILQALHKSYLLEIDEHCQSRLEALTEIYIHSENNSYFQSQVKSFVVFLKTLNKVPLLEIGSIRKAQQWDDMFHEKFFDDD